MNTANKTENLKDDIKVSFASEKRKSKSNRKFKISGPRNKHKKPQAERNNESSYFVFILRCLLILLSCLILIIIVYVVFNLVVVGTETRGIIEDLLLSDNLSESIFDIAVQKILKSFV